MSDTVRLTEADLRNAIRDPRYWQPNPDREAFAAWVTTGYRALNASRLRAADGSAIVHVRAYTRTRNGVVQHVAAHTRAARPGESLDDGPSSRSADDQADVSAAWRASRRHAPLPPRHDPTRTPSCRAKSSRPARAAAEAERARSARPWCVGTISPERKRRRTCRAGRGVVRLTKAKRPGRMRGGS